MERGWATPSLVIEVLDPQVRWYGAGDSELEDGCHNRDEALAFIRQALADGVTAGAFEFRDAGDRVVVRSTQVCEVGCTWRPGVDQSARVGRSRGR